MEEEAEEKAATNSPKAKQPLLQPGAEFRIDPKTKGGIFNPSWPGPVALPGQQNLHSRNFTVTQDDSGKRSMDKSSCSNDVSALLSSLVSPAPVDSQTIVPRQLIPESHTSPMNSESNRRTRHPTVSSIQPTLNPNRPMQTLCWRWLCHCLWQGPPALSEI